MHIRASRLIPGTPERTIELAADLRTWEQLLDSVVELRPLTSGQPDIGSRLLVVRKVGPFRSRQVFEVSDLSSTGFVIHSEGPGAGRIVLSLVAVSEADSVRVTIDLGGRITGPSALLTPLFQRRQLEEWTTFLDRLSTAAAASAA